jgi:hypothetical protein
MSSHRETPMMSSHRETPMMSSHRETPLMSSHKDNPLMHRFLSDVDQVQVETKRRLSLDSGYITDSESRYHGKQSEIGSSLVSNQGSAVEVFRENQFKITTAVKKMSTQPMQQYTYSTHELQYTCTEHARYRQPTNVVTQAISAHTTARRSLSPSHESHKKSPVPSHRSADLQTRQMSSAPAIQMIPGKAVYEQYKVTVDGPVMWSDRVHFLRRKFRQVGKALSRLNSSSGETKVKTLAVL